MFSPFILNTLLVPLLSIKNIGFMAANNIIEERNKKNFIDIYDFIKRINRKIGSNYEGSKIRKRFR